MRKRKQVCDPQEVLHTLDRLQLSETPAFVKRLEPEWDDLTLSALDILECWETNRDASSACQQLVRHLHRVDLLVELVEADWGELQTVLERLPIRPEWEMDALKGHRSVDNVQL